MNGFAKVVEVGSPKTGTSSLGHAFEILGLRHKGWDPVLHRQLLDAVGIERTLDVMRFSVEQLDEILARQWRAGALDEILSTMERYDAFEDGPWHFPGFFKIVDQVFPGSRFVLLERDARSWVASYCSHFGPGGPVGSAGRQPIDEDLAMREHRRRYDTVRAYFACRADALLIMDVCGGDGWDPLCRFLGKPSPDVPFPHLNRTSLRGRLQTRLAGMARAASRRLRGSESG